jgi:hypothetical protein
MLIELKFVWYSSTDKIMVYKIRIVNPLAPIEVEILSGYLHPRKIETKSGNWVYTERLARLLIGKNSKPNRNE